MDIFDEIIQCLKNEKDSCGNVFVSRENLTEFFGPSAQRTATAPAMQRRRESGTLPPTPVPTPAAPPRTVPEQTRTTFAASVSEAGEHPIRREIRRRDADAAGEAAHTPAVPRQTPETVASMNWDQLRCATDHCRLCRLCETRTHVVFADGNEHAELMFIGEGPGADEDAQGIPFVGKAGQLLTKMIAAMQFRREEVYIANIVKCRPPENRNPMDDEMAACLPYLQRQIELVRPKVIVLLGSVALKGLLNRSGIMRMRGHWLDYRGIMVMPTFHPAYLLRYEAGKKDAWSDLQQVMKVFGKVYRKAR